ncbi:SufD family Fe-S cluster assembly protein, partial [Bacillus cereus group sp. BC232]|uniref:SufD family Fe-S cluster assembly protein n=1 Tax=Bacillus cereus group sp. BC232 TaxID=3445338 RepID=UPI003F219D75
AKMIHLGRDTSSLITSKSICKHGGRTSYRGQVKIHKGAVNARSKVICDALILDPDSQTDTYPYNEIYEKQSRLEHEATVSRVGED